MPTPLRNLLTPRFSLRALLVVVTVGCLTLGWGANRLFQNQRALNSLQSQSLEILGGPTSGTGQHNFRFSLLDNVDVDSIELVGIAPISGPVSERAQQWGDIARLAPLTTLSICNARLPSKARSAEWNHTNFVTNMQFTHCTFEQDAFETAIEMMPQLKSLTIIGGRYETKSLSCLSKCSYLESLYITETAIPAGIVSSLRGVQLRRLRFGDEGLAGELRVELSENDVQSIVSMKQLEELEIFATPGFPVSALPRLKSCKDLKVLSLDLTNSSPENLAAAKKDLATALPNCKLKFCSVFQSP